VNTRKTARPVFIVGCPRSGTTLLRDLLRSHPNLTFPDESLFIGRFYRAYGDPASDKEAWKLACRILRTPWVANWGICLERQEVAGCRAFSEVTRRVFEAWARKEGKPRWGGKTPHYVTEIPLLRHLFPDAQVIHIIRDGRDAALSWLKARYEPQNLYKAACMWRDMVSKGRRDGSRLPPSDYLELRYKTLLAEPEKTMRQVCEFLGEPFVPAVLSPKRLAEPLFPNIMSGGPDAAFDQGVVPKNAGKWKSSMSLSQRALFESVAGDLLEELGYPIEGLAKRLSKPERMLREADHVVRLAALRLQQLKTPTYQGILRTLGWAELRGFLFPRRQVSR
jgi:Sulfotransferase family